MSEILREWKEMSMAASEALTSWVILYNKYKHDENHNLDQGLYIEINAKWALFIEKLDLPEDESEDELDNIDFSRN